MICKSSLNEEAPVKMMECMKCDVILTCASQTRGAGNVLDPTVCCACHSRGRSCYHSLICSQCVFVLPDIVLICVCSFVFVCVSVRFCCNILFVFMLIIRWGNPELARRIYLCFIFHIGLCLRRSSRESVPLVRC